MISTLDVDNLAETLATLLKIQPRQQESKNHIDLEEVLHGGNQNIMKLETYERNATSRTMRKLLKRLLKRLK